MTDPGAQAISETAAATARVIEALTALTDDVVRARVASDLASRFQAAMTEISRLRRESLDQLVERGMSHGEIAAAIGTTRSRVGQLLTSGPRPERAMLGTGTVTVAIGGKPEHGRRDSQPQYVVSAEASQAYEVISKLASSLNLSAEIEVVPPPGLVDLNRPNLVVLTSTKLVPFVSQVLASDPRYGFASDERGLYLVDKADGTEHVPPQDTAGEPVDYAYVGRLPRPDGRGTFLYAAGVHAAGTWGAAVWLAEHLDELYRQLKLKRFSLLLRVEYDVETHRPTSITDLAPLHRHEGA